MVLLSILRGTVTQFAVCGDPFHYGTDPAGSINQQENAAKLFGTPQAQREPRTSPMMENEMVR